jgi:outer membrane protein assembly factor BamB
MQRRKPRPSRARIAARRLGAICLLAALVIVGVAVTASGTGSTLSQRSAHHGGRPRSSANRKGETHQSTANLAPGSDPSVLPGPILIADRDNNRLIEVSPTGQILWQFPRPGDLARGQTFKIPDDAFFTPTGRQVIATEEDNFVISVIDVASHRIAYRYGHPGIPGSGADYLDNPDDAIMHHDGQIMLADIKNCRVIVIAPPAHQIARQLGQTGVCIHQPGLTYGSPNGAFPMLNGDTIVTEINGDWIDVLNRSGRVLSSTNAPGFTYPSDTNEVRPGVLLSADYTNPGAIETFTPSGRLLWRYSPTGADALNQPSLALPLPNGDILANDDYNHRVIVIDPHTDKIVWQYGHTHVPGKAPGYLAKPDGVDLAPPYSLVDRFR